MCNIWDYFVINLLGYHPTHLPFFNLKKKTKIFCRKFVFLFLFLAVAHIVNNSSGWGIYYFKKASSFLKNKEKIPLKVKLNFSFAGVVFACIRNYK
jgi:hypothetical protein